MLGRFLEISVYSERVLESLEFYEALGFQQVPVGETWQYPYAVVTDGRLFLGLHGRRLASPTVTFVKADLAAQLAPLRDLEIEFDFEHLGSDEFNELGFHDPNGFSIRLLEARTFSPPQLDAAFTSTCGYFVELGLPTREFAAARSFWENLGFVAWNEESAPFSRTPLTSDHLNIGLHRSRALRQPVLLFEDNDMRERLAALRERGFALGDEMPDSLEAHSNAILTAPEGTRLLLTQAAA